MTGVSRRRNERLVNLVICLLSSRRFLTAAQIAKTVPGYEHDETDAREHASFQRRFERDKSELRELGVPLEVGTTSIFDTEAGYRIPARDYALPDIELDPAAATAVALAARLWQNASLSSAAASALRKLRAAGAFVDSSPEAEGGETQLYAGLELTPVARTEPALEPLLTAVRQRQAVCFTYQPPAGSDVPSQTSIRKLQPWGAVAWRGRWYVVGHDLDRAATRCFRLSRIASPVELFGKLGSFKLPNVDLLAHVTQLELPEYQQQARVRVPRHGAAGLRRLAESTQPGPGETDILTLKYDRCEWFAARLTSYGSAIMVLEPPELRNAVVRRLAILARAPTFGESSKPKPPAALRAAGINCEQT